MTEKQNGPDLEQAKAYSMPWERLSPPFFVGRKEVINQIENCCRLAKQKIAANEPGQDFASGLTFLIQGAPGAGKTSLLSHLRKSCAIQPDGPMVLPFWG